jgi:phenylacetate-coenzyme A ligase PaaK-like adenylate-forming protein
MLKDARLRTTLGLVAAAHPHYRRRYAGLELGAVRGVADLPLLPITTKDEFLADPESFRLGPAPGLSLEERVLWEVLYTTGTTSGDPAPVYVTTSDSWHYMVHARACAEMLGLDSRDVIANVFPLTPFPMGAYVRASTTAAAIGAALVRTHTGRADPRWPVHRRLDEAVALVAQHRATVVWGVAGFVRRLLIRAAELGADLSAVRWCFITGEATSDAGVADLTRRLAAVGSAGRVANRYGSTEAGSMIACAEEAGWHNPTPEQTWYETVDPDSGAPVADGEPGLLLVTHLVQRGTVLLRYALGDVVALTRRPCPACGRTSERIVSQPVRTKGLVKIKGTLVNMQVLGDAIAEYADVQEYRVVLDRADPGDPLSADVLRVEIATRAADPERVAAAVGTRVSGLVHLTPQVRLVARDDIFDPLSAAKPRRVVDLRT